MIPVEPGSGLNVEIDASQAEEDEKTKPLLERLRALEVMPALLSFPFEPSLPRPSCSVLPVVSESSTAHQTS